MEKKRLVELVVSILLLILCTGLLVWARDLGAELSWASLPEKVAFALVVALGVRWLTILFHEIPESKDIYSSSGSEIRRAIERAENRIWILQTWLPGVGGDAKLISEKNIDDVRVVLASFAEGSPIYARIKTRKDLLVGSKFKDIVDAAQNNSAGSALPFEARGKKQCLKFTRYHQPGWIAVIDNDVFWGATPLDDDNWSVPEVCYRAPKKNTRAKFWLSQFDLLWRSKDPLTLACLSHSFDEETRYNPRLARGTVTDPLTTSQF